MDGLVDVLFLVLWMLLLCSVSGTYSALEILSFVQPDKKSDETGGNIRYVNRLSEKPSTTILFIALIHAVFTVLVVAFSLHLSAQDFFASLSGWTRYAGIALFVCLAVVFPITAGRYLAVRRTSRFLEITRFLVLPLYVAFAPVVAILGWMVKKVSPRLLESLAYRIFPLKQKLELFGNGNDGMEEEDQLLVASVLDFGDTKAREVMVPRIDVVALDVNMPRAEAIRTVIEAGHSRVPVYDETIDKVIGILHTKDLLHKIVSGEDFTLSQLTREAFFVPESKKIDDLLTEFKKLKKHIAIAVDEYGGTAGIITMEDILEELVGDIQDEFDSEEALIKIIDPDKALCNAKVHIDELRDRLGLDISGGDTDSLGGFLYESIGRVPKKGEILRHRGIEYEIRSVQRQRIDKVLIKGLSSIKKKSGEGFKE